MPSRTDRRRGERQARVDQQKRLSPKAGFWDRVSTDMIVGLMIVAVLAIAITMFATRELTKSSPPEPPFDQVYAIQAVQGAPKTFLAADAKGLLQTTDGGKKWRTLAFEDQPVTALVRDPVVPQTYLAVAGGVLHQSDDSGATWRLLPTNLPVGEIGALAADPASLQQLYAYVKGDGLYRSTDGGTAWARAQAITDADLTTLAVKANDPQTVYAFHTRRALVRSTDGGKTFTAIGETSFATAVASILTVTDAPSRVYAVASGSIRTIYKSDDDGLTWKASSEGVTTVEVAVITRDPASADIYVTDASGVLYVSHNQGDLWLPLNLAELQ